ncbi:MULTISPECIES: 1-deoxy-D-xylulose-5-phosphate reductoisomerase [unclassified Campylobacter]|uniref:1-deoxy-D-xylulose-5-phosphate reductoisomerase n=1 Tax=unclassified Campylobacter TaxID=2593542 RepID=UPI001237B83D|nr:MULTISPECIES: 1-deoxy-D-xylulose-5-phosphate reductoisomerase [unclassified Campylobacter]KAA6224575.1 1-deoxy-D-xylulose-5-phosphate reductoisomerase [Campylobacter sp. LR185c]KAA6224922.1 1-deoxy-D-xylulose-5-phosphate reductoisomerase [Campylobacter sp. LR196d]KAA6225419.1 1-deoxy-D-xylulose-5-phosphate reductoisomerase [Campylobacter sp. LR286c]KAA6229123.1 1-deoxy-D-xylulose-5-phosphate reductoisomerase [Campylobacter sp. LR291e]KAA8603255.1 1-deoxy-D-xylulose-5-phosphate reductoisomer
MIVFGSTGSIGINALKLAKRAKLKISALACGENIRLLNKQIELFKPDFVCIKNKKDKSLINHKHVFSGQKGLEKILSECEDELFLNAIVGFAGLKSTLKASELNKTIALANKESLVVGGKFLHKAKINPIDSEHCALKILLDKKEHIKKLYITASGGATFKLNQNSLKNLNTKEALKHPNWKMGSKITIDSATMANKLFEIIEAYHLYRFKNIDALIEPNSIVHAMCEFYDGGTSAYFSRPNMQLSIAQAIFSRHSRQIIKAVDFSNLASIKFHKINLKKYPIFSLKNRLLKEPNLGVIINAANEIAVSEFLKGHIKFIDIAKKIFLSLDHFQTPKLDNIEEIFECDLKVREFVRKG